MDFWKLFRMNVVQIFKFGFEIFEILQHEIPSGNCFLPFWLRFLSCYSINLGNISSIYKSFEQIHRDAAPLSNCEVSRKKKKKRFSGFQRDSNFHEG